MIKHLRGVIVIILVNLIDADFILKIIDRGINNLLNSVIE